MQQIAGILFDKDGTLFDFEATWGVWAAELLTDLADGDTGLAHSLGDAIGFDLGAQSFAPESPAIAETPEMLAALMLPHLPGTGLVSLTDRINAAAETVPLQQAVPLPGLLDGLRGWGLALGIATNDAEQPARAHLAQVGIEDRFDFIAGCDSGFGAKPAPGQLFAFADRIRQAPDQILMVGDSRHDLEAGRAAGMGCVGVLTGIAGEGDLSDLADIVLPDIGHLPEYLGRLAA